MTRKPTATGPYTFLNLEPFGPCRGTSQTRKRTHIKPYRRSLPRVLAGSYGSGRFLIGEVPLYRESCMSLNKNVIGNREV